MIKTRSVTKPLNYFSAAIFCLVTFANSLVALIQLDIVETPVGVTFSYSGTWQVAQTPASGSWALRSSGRVMTFPEINSNLYFNGDDIGDGLFAWHQYIPSGENWDDAIYSVALENTPLPSLNASAFTEYQFVGSATGTPFALEYLEPGDGSTGIRLLGPDAGWLVGDSVNGTALAAGQTLSDLLLSSGSGSFDLGGQTINWSIQAIPEPRSATLLVSALVAVAAFFLRHRKN